MRNSYKKEDTVDAIKHEFEWRDAWLRAIALAWSDPKLKDRLIRDPETFLEEFCNYKLPDMLSITVVDDPEQRWEAGSKDKPGDFKWHLRKHELKLFLPSAPLQKELYAVALADYDSTGAPYPFTTLC